MKLIKKVSQTIAVIGKVLNSKNTSAQDTYSCDYINNELNTKQEKIVTETKTVNSASFYKMGNIVIVQGWLLVNDKTLILSLPYKPIQNTQIASTGLNPSMEPLSIGHIYIDTSGVLKADYNVASTYGTTGFIYYTSD